MNLFDFNDSTPEQHADAAETLHAANIARAIFHRRLEAGWSQGHLAALAQTTQARVSEIESLKGDPKLSTLGRVAYALGCMIDVVPIMTTVATAPLGYSGGVTSVNSMMTTIANRAAQSTQFQVGSVTQVSSVKSSVKLRVG